MNKLKDWFNRKTKDNEGLVGGVIYFGIMFLVLFLTHKDSPHINVPIVKSDWNKYYETRYFLKICDQLRKSNKRASDENIKTVAQNIVDVIKLKYSVADLPKINPDTLEEIAYQSFSEEIIIYTEQLKLNVELKK